MVHWRSAALLGGLSNLEHVEGWSKAGSLELCWKESGSSRHGAVMNWWYPAAGAEGIQGRAGTTEGVPGRTEEY